MRSDFTKEVSVMATNKTALQILDDPDFKALVSKKNTISIILTIVELVLYFGFVGLIAYNKPFLAQKMSPDSATTIGIPIAVMTIVLSWVLTAGYIFWANAVYDKEVQKIKDKMGG